MSTKASATGPAATWVERFITRNKYGITRPSNLYAEQLKQMVLVLSAVQIAQFLCIQLHVDQTDHTAVLIHDGKRQKLVENEKLTGVQHCCMTGNGNDRLDHDLRKPLQGIAEKQSTSGNNPKQASIRVDHVKIDDPPLRLFFPDVF